MFGCILLTLSHPPPSLPSFWIYNTPPVYKTSDAFLFELSSLAENSLWPFHHGSMCTIHYYSCLLHECKHIIMESVHAQNTRSHRQVKDVYTSILAAYTSFWFCVASECFCFFSFLPMQESIPVRKLQAVCHSVKMIYCALVM